MKIWKPKEEAERLNARFTAIKNRAAFAREHQIKGGQSMIYQHITGNRPMNLDAATRYALAFKIPLHDISPRLAKETQAAITTQAGPPTVAPSEELVIPQYDTGGRMGHGFVLTDQPGVIKSWNVSPDWLRHNIPSNTGVQNLCIVTGFGPSMMPMFNPGDPLLIDSGINEIGVDGVYFFGLGNEGFIKLVQRVPEGGAIRLRAKSKNPDYDPFWIDESMGFRVFGRVLRIWNGENV